MDKKQLISAIYVLIVKGCFYCHYIHTVGYPPMPPTHSSSQYVRSMLESPDEGHTSPLPNESQNIENFEEIYLESTFDVVRSIMHDTHLIDL